MDCKTDKFILNQKSLTNHLTWTVSMLVSKDGDGHTIETFSTEATVSPGHGGCSRFLERGGLTIVRVSGPCMRSDGHSHRIRKMRDPMTTNRRPGTPSAVGVYILGRDVTA